MLRRKLTLKNISKIVAHATTVFCVSASTSCMVDDVFGIEDTTHKKKNNNSISVQASQEFSSGISTYADQDVGLFGTGHPYPIGMVNFNNARVEVKFKTNDCNYLPMSFNDNTFDQLIANNFIYDVVYVFDYDLSIKETTGSAHYVHCT
jgi:hypothetical protein